MVKGGLVPARGGISRSQTEAKPGGEGFKARGSLVRLAQEHAQSKHNK